VQAALDHTPMRRRLSSQRTLLMKIVLPAFWIAMFGVGTINLFLFSDEGLQSPPAWVTLFVWIAGSVFFLWDALRLKVVNVDEHFLYVSNYLKEIAIPLSNIYDVTENFWLNTHPVTIHLKSPSEFGGRIVFMPKTRFLFFSSHPVVKELKQLARGKVQSGK
jgi:hypothetical protein